MKLKVSFLEEGSSVHVSFKEEQMKHRVAFQEENNEIRVGFGTAEIVDVGKRIEPYDGD